MDPRQPRERGRSGILAAATQLDSWLQAVMVVLAGASVTRYLSGHGLSDQAPAVLAVAALLLVLFFASPERFGQRSTLVGYGWCAALVGCWVGLVVLAPSFSWLAVPLAFVVLRVLPFVGACVTIGAMLATVVVAWSMMQDRFDPTVVAGPLAVATLAIVAYRALERESALRRELLDELRDAQSELADAQHTAGALSERSRLSREIHDSVAQALSSINLLLQAAEHRWGDGATAARNYVRQASLTARDGLVDVRRVVHDLTSADFEDGSSVALSAALARVCDEVTVDSGVLTELQIHGDGVLLPADTATALIRSARGALANVVEHSGARRATVSLTYQPDAVLLDVRDDGCGFTNPPHNRAEGRGRGLAGIERRARSFGGHLNVESTPGEGTAIAICIPLEPRG